MQPTRAVPPRGHRPARPHALQEPSPAEPERWRLQPRASLAHRYRPDGPAGPPVTAGPLHPPAPKTAPASMAAQPTSPKTTTSSSSSSSLTSSTSSSDPPLPADLIHKSKAAAAVLRYDTLAARAPAAYQADVARHGIRSEAALQLTEELQGVSPGFRPTTQGQLQEELERQAAALEEDICQLRALLAADRKRAIKDF